VHGDDLIQIKQRASHEKGAGQGLGTPETVGIVAAMRRSFRVIPFTRVQTRRAVSRGVGSQADG
jgi:hypothetical protein